MVHSVLFEITFINESLPIISVIIAWYTLYLSRRPKESKFKLIEARIKKQDNQFVQVKVFVQNLGEGIALLRWEHIFIDLKGKRYDIHSPDEWEWPTQPNDQTFKWFTFLIPLHIDLTGGYFVAKGAYSTHEEKMVEKTWKMLLSGNLFRFRLYKEKIKIFMCITNDMCSYNKKKEKKN